MILGVIAALKIGRAIRSFNTDVARDWAMGSLTAEVSMSRSMFIEHFRTHVRISPLG